MCRFERCSSSFFSLPASENGLKISAQFQCQNFKPSFRILNFCSKKNCSKNWKKNLVRFRLVLVFCRLVREMGYSKVKRGFLSVPVEVKLSTSAVNYVTLTFEEYSNKLWQYLEEQKYLALINLTALQMLKKLKFSIFSRFGRNAFLRSSFGR